MKILCSEIVKRAQQLADLENSSFISWNENNALLNEHYQDIYQKTINNGDKYFLETLEVTSNPFELPSDFYQLNRVYTMPNNRGILRRSENANPNTPSYEIVNNKLCVFGVHVPRIFIDYWKVPQKLSVPNEKLKIELPSLAVSNFVADVYDKKCAYYDVNNTKVICYDFSKNEIDFEYTLSTPSDTIDSIYCFNNYIVAIGHDTSLVSVVYDITYDGNASRTSGATISNIMYTRKKEFCYVSVSGVEYILFCANRFMQGRKIRDISDRTTFITYFNNNDIFIGCWTDDFAQLYFVDSNTGEVKIYDMESDTIKTVDNCSVDWDVFRYIFPDLIVNQTFIESFEHNLKYDETLGVNKIDDKTGYGVTTRNNEILSTCEDVAIEYPNNLFIKMLCYKMAMSYRAKQNAPIDALSVMYDNAEEEFYDTISQDSNEFIRVKNDY